MKSAQFTPARSGLYALPADPAPVLSAARSAGLAVYAVDLRGARDKPARLQALARALRFPAGFGGNWDALADCLQDLGWLQDQGWMLVLRGTAGTEADQNMLRSILADSAAAWRARGRVFVVFSDAAELPPWPA